MVNSTLSVLRRQVHDFAVLRVLLRGALWVAQPIPPRGQTMASTGAGQCGFVWLRLGNLQGQGFLQLSRKPVPRLHYPPGGHFVS